MIRHPSRYPLILVAALSLQLSGCSDGSPEATNATPSTSATAEQSVTEPPPSEATDSTPESLRDYEGPIDPGPHRVPLISWERTYPVDALVQVPEGLITPGGWVIENNEDATAYGDLMFFGDVDRLDTDPCGAGKIVKPGPSVRALAEAIARQPGATAPEAVSLGGYRGLYVELRVPGDLSRCDSGEFTVLTVDHGFWYAGLPHSVLRFWIVDVEGQRVAVAVKVVPGRTTHASEFIHMAETVRFVENAGG